VSKDASVKLGGGEGVAPSMVVSALDEEEKRRVFVEPRGLIKRSFK